MVLQGDHGYRALEKEQDRKAERLSILNAYLLPGNGRGNLSASIHPYETFRLIFDTYF